MTMASQSSFAPAGLGAVPRSARQILTLIDHLPESVELVLPGGQPWHGRGRVAAARLTVHDWAFFDHVLARGELGLGESYVAGLWDCADLPGLLAYLGRQRQALGRAVHGQALQLMMARLRHWLRPNTREGARRNIMAHYDLGNAFYALWLDASMSYSAACFAHPDEPLERAQQRKYRRILDRLEARPGQRILEIGCGWGGFAEIAAAEYGCRVVGVTLSPAQLEWAQRRMAAAGLDDRVELRLQDYRDVPGRFDHIVSIEMLEAVGERYWPTYFRTLRDRLAPGGRAMIQVITIDDGLFPAYRRQPDFIRQHVFPGGMLPGPRRLGQLAAGAGLALNEDHAFGDDYALTLARWRAAYEQALPQVRAQGFDERFIRLWRYYLALCEGGFRARNIDVRQTLLQG